MSFLDLSIYLLNFFWTRLHGEKMKFGMVPLFHGINTEDDNVINGCNLLKKGHIGTEITWKSQTSTDREKEARHPEVLSEFTVKNKRKHLVLINSDKFIHSRTKKMYFGLNKTMLTAE